MDVSLDPSLLHNGFLFDKRQMETEMEKKKSVRPIGTTVRPIFRTSPTQTAYYGHSTTTFRPKMGTPVGLKKPVQSITFKPRLITTSAT